MKETNMQTLGLNGQLLIDGHWVEGKGIAMASSNPVDDNPLWHGQGADSNQVAQAVDAARAAFKSWRALTPENRYHYVNQFVEALKQEKATLAELITLESGKALWDATTEVGAMIGKGDISWRAYQERTGVVDKAIAQGTLRIQHKPHGVLGVFGPYNFPGHLPNGHIIPALIAGNCVVYKPSELTPAVAEWVVRLWQSVGLPKGVLNLIQGAKETGANLAQKPQLDGLLFTGSAKTGRLLHQQLAGQPQKILALEMGGNNALLIDQVADIEGALFTSLFSAFVSSGQRCTCARRILIPDTQWGDDFLQRLLAASQQLRVDRGNATPQPFMGAVIDANAVKHLQQGVQQLEQAGATVLLPSQHHNANGTLMSPCVVDMSGFPKTQLTDVDHELFGPVLQVYRYTDINQGIELCNQTRFGLAAGVVSDNVHVQQQFYEEIRAGIVNCNKPLTGASSEAPFGGVGISGNGRPSAYYAADYCAYPVASIEDANVALPENRPPGMDVWK